MVGSLLISKKLSKRLGFNKSWLLTTEVLTKKGLEGPSRCTLSYTNDKSFDHLFLNCNFSRLTWNFFLKSNNTPYPSGNVNDWWTNWRDKHMISKCQIKWHQTFSPLSFAGYLFYSEGRSSSEVAKTNLFLVQV